MYSKRDGKKIRKTFPSMAAAVAWRQDAAGAVRRNQLRAPIPITLAHAAAQWLDGARAGVIRTRAGYPYKPSAIRGYEAALRLRLLPEFGRRKLSEITRNDLQDFVDALVASGMSPSAVGVSLLPARAIYKRAVARGELAVNPTTGLAMPAVHGGRDRIASPEECGKLLAALPGSDRPLWATAMYAGLRRGELMALRIEDVNLGTGLIRVSRGWDHDEGEIDTKNRKERRVPMAAVLRDYLDQHLLGLKWSEGLMFGASAVSPFAPTPVRIRASAAWRTARLDPITLHECRHTFASLMIAAGVNAKALSIYMGHATVAFTLDKYGHLMPGNEHEAAGLLDAYLARGADHGHTTSTHGRRGGGASEAHQNSARPAEQPEPSICEPRPMCDRPHGVRTPGSSGA